MALKEIEKLKEKVEKDPNSKLFVPLAEEYRKEGMTDDAIRVLREGIEKQPSYMSARVALGKIYLEKGMAKEARDEFENVIKSIPDNLYAHKKLAEIYRDSGDRDLAIKSYRTVLKLNSMDEDALYHVNELERLKGMDEPEPSQKEESLLEVTSYADQKPEAVEAVPEEFSLSDVEIPSEETPAAAALDEDFDDFKNSLFGEAASAEATEPAAQESSEAMDFGGEPLHTETSAHEPAVAEEKDLWAGIEDSEARDATDTFELADELTDELPDELPKEVSRDIPEQLAGIEDEEVFELEEIGDDVSADSEEIPDEDVFELSLDEEESVAPLQTAPVIEAPKTSRPAAPQPAPAEDDFSGLMAEPEIVQPQAPEPAPPRKASVPVEEIVAEADRLIGLGNFAGAIAAYRKVLAVNPDDRKTLQRVEELKALLKMMGQDKEALIFQLNAFLEGIMKRRDGLSRSS